MQRMQMEKSKVRGKKRSTVDEAAMQTALQEILQRKLKVKDASAALGIPIGTVYARLRRVKKQLPESEKVSLMMGLKKKEMVNKFASQQVFTMPQEKNLVAYLLASSKLNFGLTLLTTRELAYKYAVRIGQKVPLSWEINQRAGKRWARLFLKRHREISLRKPEATSLARNSGFTRENVEIFFNNLEEIMEQHQFEPCKIFNLDETGLNTVLQPPKVVASTKSKQVGKCVTAERGESITICAFVNAAGEALPPVYLFPRKRNHPEYMEGCFEGSVAFFNQKGYMNTDTFLKTLEHFKIQTGASKDNQILLILDNHVSHISLDAIKFCRENGIHMLTLPPHTSHRTQPLDLAVFAPFKTYCAISFDNWMSSRVGNRVTLHNIARLSSEPLRKCMTSKNIKAGFMKSGIHPMDSSKLLAFFESTESTSSMTSSHIVADNSDETILMSSFSTTMNATSISQETIAKETVSQSTMFQDTRPRDEEVTSEQDGLVFSAQKDTMASAQDEVVSSEQHDIVTSEHDEMGEVNSPGDEVLTYSYEALDLSTSGVSRELNYSFNYLHNKIFPSNSCLPLDLTKTGNPQCQLLYGGLEVIRPLPTPPKLPNSKTGKKIVSTIVTKSPEVKKKEETEMKKKIKQENDLIRSQGKSTKAMKRKVLPDVDNPPRKRGRPRKLI